MSKMSNIAMELDEHAVELGFVDHLEALANGYDWRIDETGVAKLFKNQDPQEEAHEAWLKEKACAVEGLEDLRKRIPYDWTETIDVLDRAIKFVKEAHD